MNEIAWAKWPWNRCKARLTRKSFPASRTGYFGRCDRQPHTEGAHALERGMEMVTWNETHWGLISYDPINLHEEYMNLDIEGEYTGVFFEGKS